MLTHKNNHEYDQISNNKPGWWSCFWVLTKRLFKSKFRDTLSIFEYLFSLILPFFIILVYMIGKDPIEASPNPKFDEVEELGTEFGKFLFATGNATLVAMPDTESMHRMIKNLFQPLKDLVIKVDFVNDLQKMEDLIYESGSNGLGIYWANSEVEDAEKNPDIRVFIQNIYGKPSQDIFRLIRLTLSLKFSKFSFALTKFNYQKFAAPAVFDNVELFPTYMIFAVWPIFFSIMPEIQTALNDKDNKILSLFLLMGCPEHIYWLTIIFVAFVTGLLPYALLTIISCYFIGFKDTSPLLFCTVWMLYVVSHIAFVMFIVTFIKKGATGRMFIIVFLILSIFTCFLHRLFTLSKSNNLPITKDLFSLFPFSCYQMEISEMWIQSSLLSRPLNWGDMNLDCVYPMGKGIAWLSFDAVLYFALFVFFNAVNKRAFGEPPLGWKGIFSVAAWKRFFRKRETKEEIANSEYMLRVRGLSKVYKGVKDTRALDNIDFDLKVGDITVIIGPNGAGKSTFINIISGTIGATTGNVSILGSEKFYDFSEIRNYLGICYQENVFINTLSCRENIQMFGTFRGMSKKEINAFIEEYFTGLQMIHTLDTYAGELSGGQKRKLCIAISMLGKPPFIIMDEPVAGVDVQSRVSIWQTISSLRDVSIIITSHALDEAESISKMIYIFSKGNIAFSGTSTELRKTYHCGYILKVELNNKNYSEFENKISEFVTFTTDAESNAGTYKIPVCDEVGDLLDFLEGNKEELGIASMSFNIEQLEDMIINMIQNDENEAPQ